MAVLRLDVAELPAAHPGGGLSGKEWYELTRWNDRTYGGTFGVDGETPGLDVNVTSAQELYDALEDRRVARINVTKSFSLEFVPSSTYYDDAFDDITGGEGGEAGGGTTRVEPSVARGRVPDLQDVTVRAGPQCLETTEGHWPIDGRESHALRRARGRRTYHGGPSPEARGGTTRWVHVHEGRQQGTLTTCTSSRGRYFPDAGKANRARRRGDDRHTSIERERNSSAGGPGYRRRQQRRGLVQGRACRATSRSPRIAFADNQVTGGNAGAVGSDPGRGARWVIFDASACSAGTRRLTGGGGAAWGERPRHLRRVQFIDNAAMGGRSASDGRRRFNRRFEVRGEQGHGAGGAVFFFGHGNGLVQECEFERNSAVTGSRGGFRVRPGDILQERVRRRTRW